MLHHGLRLYCLLHATIVTTSIIRVYKLVSWLEQIEVWVLQKSLFPIISVRMQIIANSRNRDMYYETSFIVNDKHATYEMAERLPRSTKSRSANLPP